MTFFFLDFVVDYVSFCDSITTNLALIIQGKSHLRLFFFWLGKDGRERRVWEKINVILLVMGAFGIVQNYLKGFSLD